MKKRRVAHVIRQEWARLINHVRPSLNRRRILTAAPAWISLAAANLSLSTISRAALAGLLAKFDELLTEFQIDPLLAENVRNYHELQLVFPDEQLERAPLTSVPSNLPISSRASDLIIYCEVSSETVYRQKYQHPVWPQGRSGVTIGIGYDIGYSTPTLLKAGWEGYIADDSITKLASACGITGQGARDVVESLQDIQISWSAARGQYIEREQPRYVGLTQRALTNFSELPLDARGALVSLVYNRGATFSVPADRDPSGRYAEMRNILSLMRQRKFAEIPNHIRGMRRLWVDDPAMVGVVKRRELEATLFEIGLGLK
jgi:hypothetical protein